MLKESLLAEIDSTGAIASWDKYSVSVGEWVSLFQNKELVIHSVYNQERKFFWSDQQRTNFVESLLIGIPVLPIVVSQNLYGAWELIDGLQRLSTVLQLAGVLEDRNGVRWEPLILQETNYLPSLAGETWKSLTPGQRMAIKRVKTQAYIVSSSNEHFKRSLFSRFNP
jgi:hypothetical protein